MDNQKPLVLTIESKKKYLQSLIGKCHKILHLIEEKDITGYSPLPFIYNQILETNEANILFEGSLVTTVVKLKLIHTNLGSQEFSFQECKKQIFEITRILNNLLRTMEE